VYVLVRNFLEKQRKEIVSEAFDHSVTVSSQEKCAKYGEQDGRYVCF